MRPRSRPRSAGCTRSRSQTWRPSAVFARNSCSSVSREHPIAIARIDDLRPDVGGAEPALDGIAEQLLGPLAHERAGQRDGIGLPDDRVDAVHEITEPALGSFYYSGAVRTVVSHGTVAGAEIASHVPRMPWRHVRL